MGDPNVNYTDQIGVFPEQENSSNTKVFSKASKAMIRANNRNHQEIAISRVTPGPISILPETISQRDDSSFHGKHRVKMPRPINHEDSPHLDLSRDLEHLYNGKEESKEKQYEEQNEENQDLRGVHFEFEPNGHVTDVHRHA